MLPSYSIYRHGIIDKDKKEHGDIQVGNTLMVGLNILALNTIDNGTTKLIMLLLVIVAVILIITGCIIAMFTLRKRLKAQNAYLDPTQWDRRA